MFWTTIILLLLLWGIGLMNGYNLGGVIHILPLMAVLVLLIRMIQRRPTAEKRGES